jgi:hypothetical protein
MSAPVALRVAPCAYRLVRFDDTYLLHFDSYGTPVWVPKDEAKRFWTQQQARGAAKRARAYLGGECHVAIVRVLPIGGAK